MIPLFAFASLSLLATGLVLVNVDLPVLPDAHPIAAVTSLTSGAALFYISNMSDKYEQYMILAYAIMFSNPLYIFQYASSIGYSGFYWYIWPLALQSVLLGITGGAALLERFVWRTPRWLWTAFVHLLLLAIFLATGAVSMDRIDEHTSFETGYMRGPVVAFSFGSALLPLAVLISDDTFRHTLLASMFLFQQVAFNLLLLTYFTTSHSSWRSPSVSDFLSIELGFDPNAVVDISLPLAP